MKKKTLYNWTKKKGNSRKFPFKLWMIMFFRLFCGSVFHFINWFSSKLKIDKLKNHKTHWEKENFYSVNQQKMLIELHVTEIEWSANFFVSNRRHKIDLRFENSSWKTIKRAKRNYVFDIIAERRESEKKAVRILQMLLKPFRNSRTKPLGEMKLATRQKKERARERDEKKTILLHEQSSPRFMNALLDD